MFVHFGDQGVGGRNLSGHPGDRGVGCVEFASGPFHFCECPGVDSYIDALDQVFHYREEPGLLGLFFLCRGRGVRPVTRGIMSGGWSQDVIFHFLVLFRGSDRDRV